jgi:thiol-disulfide isomerase/thioredoxin
MLSGQARTAICFISLLATSASTELAAQSYRAVLDLAGGTLGFGIELHERAGAWDGRLCNAATCQPFSAVRRAGDSLHLELADFAASISAVARGDSLIGAYRNVGIRGPRTIPFRAVRGPRPATPAPEWLSGTWHAWFRGATGDTPRVFEFRNGPAGLEGTIIGNSGDYGAFGGTASRDSFSLSRFDGSFVYLLAGRLAGDSLVGTFHAGLRSQTPFVAVRARGPSPLTPPTEVTQADTAPFRFAFPDLDGKMVTSSDPRFRGKVLVVDVFGTWCPTCHDAAPTLVALHRSRAARGLEVVGLAFEVSGDTAVDGALVRRYRDKFGIGFPLLLAGISEVDQAAASLPQLEGFTAFPTTLFIGRDGRVRRVHAGFHGPATGSQYDATVREFERLADELLAEPAP